MSGPCLCGADDCERCHPGSRRWVQCARCGRWERACYACGWDIGHDAEDGVCDECLADDEAEANGDVEGELKGVDQ